MAKAQNDDVTEKDLRSAAYSAANKRLRESNPEQFKQFVGEEMKARGVDWTPRLTPAERARAEVQRLLTEHPELADEFTSATD